MEMVKIMKIGMEVISMKKKSKLFALVGVALLLTSCNEIIAKPTNLDKDLVDELSHEVNNSFKKIYDEYRDSPNFKQYILDDVLHLVAVDLFGEYDELDTDSNFKIAVDDRLKEKLYDEIRGGTYQKRSYFQERQFVIDKVYGGQNKYIVVDETPLTISEVRAKDESFFFSDGLFLPSVNKENYADVDGNGDYIHGLVHYDYYSDYVVSRFLKDVYREKLVEKYVVDEQSHILGRNYARKVNYIAIKKSSEHPNAVEDLFEAFIEENIMKADGNPDLNILANAWRGHSADFFGNEADLLDKANVIVAGEYDHTLTGDVDTEYNKIDDNPDLTDRAIEDKFTGGGKYKKEIGLEIELNEVRKKSFVTSDWAIKNGGLSALPEALRNRVFNIGTANGVDFVEDDKGVLADAGKYHDQEKNPNTFVRNIHGTYYLTPKMYEQGNNFNFLFTENDTYYIVQIEEAVNTSKLTEGNASYYLKTGKFATEDELNENIISEVARLIAALEATKTNAFTHHLENLEIVFHDEEIKDFFADQFPNIFGDDKE